MNTASYSAIGGFFGLDVSDTGMFHKNATYLNSGRSCLEYILTANDVKNIYLPKYTCEVVIDTVKKLGIEYELYSIDSDLKITGHIDLPKDAYILYTNYFGIMDEYCTDLSSRYKNSLILDYSQAFYAMPPIECSTFYSPRKFFGVPDGGILYSQAKLNGFIPESTSYQRTEHLLKRLDVGPEDTYRDFIADEKSLDEEPMAYMSSLTKKLLCSLDYDTFSEKRRLNFALLHDKLKDHNKIRISNLSSSPLVYPYLAENNLHMRRALKEKKIFTATYWLDVLDRVTPSDVEHMLVNNMIPIPIDQRYDEENMTRILEVIGEHNN
jgi:hypothetical protein